MTDTLRWGILGTGRIAQSFAAALAHSRTGRLVAVASRGTAHGGAFGDARRVTGYQALLDAPDIDAVYIATPHPAHAEWAIKAARAGKHVLCEKPIGMNAAEAAAIIDAARRHGVFLMEAFMYRAHPQTAKLVELLRAGEIGEIRMIQASFGYAKPFDAEARQYAQALGGGGILDVGCYPVSFARLVAGVAAGQDFADPVKVTAAGHLGATGVDEWTAATLAFPGGLIAEVSTAVGVALENVARIFGTTGRIDIASPWFCSGREGGHSTITIHRPGEVPREIAVETPDWLYAIEADAVSQYLADGQATAPAPSWADTLGNMRALDAWRDAIGLVYDCEKPGARGLTLAGERLTRPARSAMPMLSLPDVPQPASQIALGTVGVTTHRDACVLFDAFFEAGGTTFDTAAHYGAGRSDRLLGDWMRDRGVRGQVVVIGKGAHSPNCFPEAVTSQLHESLERLKTDRIDVYFLHRDNPDVPVGEFVDVLDEHVRAGRIRIFGGSNWTTERIDAANAYAAAHGRAAFRALSNQFSLAEMIVPVWPGCLGAGDAASIAWLRHTGTALFAWSAQARGFFTPRADDPRLQDKLLVDSFFNAANFGRRARAGELAARKGTTMAAIALAYTLAQDFTLLPLIGPVTLDELRTSLTVLDTRLTPAEAEWLRDG